MKCQCCNGSGEQVCQKTLGAKMRAARLKADIGLREMARRMVLSPTFIHQLETGTRRWTDRYQRFYQKQIEQNK